jgi:hypothetical protein
MELTAQLEDDVIARNRTRNAARGMIAFGVLCFGMGCVGVFLIRHLHKSADPIQLAVLGMAFLLATLCIYRGIQFLRFVASRAKR